MTGVSQNESKARLARDRIGRSSTVRTQAELEAQLRRRLLILTQPAAASMTAVALIGIAVTWPMAMAHPAAMFARLPGYGILLVVGLVDVVLAIILRASPNLALGALRRVEATLLGSTMVATAGIFTLALDALLPQLPRFVELFSFLCSAAWFEQMLAYALFIPNSWQRCARVMVAYAVMAIAPDIALLAHRHTGVSVMLSYLSLKGVWLGFGAALAIYGSYRIDVLEQTARDAQQLGPYLLKRILGKGGMGEVYLAEHKLLKRPCAIKLIPPGGDLDASVIARFEREVQVTATLTHPNTIQIFDYGRAEDGTFYYAMEYMSGLSLDELIAREGPIDPGRAVRLLIQIAGALGEAHARGLIHRDIKPSNVIVGERGGVRDVAKLLDFGLVAEISPALKDAKLTRDGVIIGTPAFMSPEQCGGDVELSPASDIYGMGALAYFLLSGAVLFPGKSPLQMLAAHIYETPVLSGESGVVIPIGLHAVIRRCLAKSPSERFANATQLEEALLDCVAATAA